MVLIGILLVVAGVAGFVFAHRTRAEVHAMIGAETLPVADLDQLHVTAVEIAGPGGFRRVCEVVGTAVAGPAGPLTAELSGTACMWHRHRVQRRYRHVSHDSKGRRQVTEWVLRPGAGLCVHGEASDRTGQLAFGRPESGPYFVSTRSEEELRRSRTTRQRLFASGGVAGVLVGLGLVVAGLF